jgi:hypothetical protein
MCGVSTSRKMATFARNCRKSPAYLRNIPVFGRLCAEIFFDLHCAVGRQSVLSSKCPNQTGYPENDRLILTQGGMTNGCDALLGYPSAPVSVDGRNNSRPASSVVVPDRSFD